MTTKRLFLATFAFLGPLACVAAPAKQSAAKKAPEKQTQMQTQTRDEAVRDLDSGAPFKGPAKGSWKAAKETGAPVALVVPLANTASTAVPPVGTSSKKAHTQKAKNGNKATKAPNGPKKGTLFRKKKSYIASDADVEKALLTFFALLSFIAGVAYKYPSTRSSKDRKSKGDSAFAGVPTEDEILLDCSDVVVPQQNTLFHNSVLRSEAWI